MQPKVRNIAYCDGKCYLNILDKRLDLYQQDFCWHTAWRRLHSFNNDKNTY